MESSTVLKLKNNCTHCAQTETRTRSERRASKSSIRLLQQHSPNGSSSSSSKSKSAYRSCKSSQSSRLLLIAMTLIASMPMPEARHVQIVKDYSVESTLPVWQSNPFLGLADDSNMSNSKSYEELLEDDNNSSSSSSFPHNSHSELMDDSSSSSSSVGLEDSLYDEIAIAAEALRKLHQRRTRMRRRRSHSLHYFTRVENESRPAWENPCGGYYEPLTDEEDAASKQAHQRGPLRKHLSVLRNNTRSEYRLMREKSYQAIDIKDFGIWSFYRNGYKFLPTIRKNSNVCLKRWYGDIQTYIGTFEQLGRAHYKHDKHEQNHISGTTDELHSLLLSARRLLCEIETTINASYPQSNRADKLYVPTREEMRARLQFRTNIEGNDAVPAEVDTIDLKYAKHHYFLYMTRLWHVMQYRLKHNEITDCATTAASAMAASLTTSGELNVSELKSSGMTSASGSSEHKERSMRRRKRVKAHQIKN